MVTRRRIGLGAALVVAGLGTFVATGLGDGSGGRLSAAAGDAVELRAHRVTAPGGAAGKVVAHASASKVIYKETNPVAIGSGGEFTKVGKCPRGSGVVDGYYGRDDAGGPFGVTDNGGVPTLNARKWFFALMSTAPGAEVFFGLICVKP